MPDTSPTPTPPRRFRFGLRSLFVLVTVAAVVCAWAACSLNWIRQRKSILDQSDVFTSGSGEVRAPGGLWIFGEVGYRGLWIGKESKATIERARRLFPEASTEELKLPNY